MAIKLVLGSSIIKSYQRLAYTPWHALAEFVDNSTQSFANNRNQLVALVPSDKLPLEVRITYDKKNGIIRIHDTAMGMSLRELQNALKIGRPPANTSGRSQFGMGLKTAACWLGNEWTVVTKKLGETVEHQVTIDVDKVASGKLNLPYKEIKNRDPGLHYTRIEVKRLHRKFQGRTLGRIKDFLRSMYREDLRSKTMHLEWEGSPLSWDDKLEFAIGRNGPYRKDFSFKVNKKKVEGWVGVLAKGSRALAGFSILHRGRVVRGWPDSWRPEEIFGQLQGSNNLVNQRITGEIHLNDFDVSHTKDDILWKDNEEEEVQEKLAEAAQDLVKVAKDRRSRSSDDFSGPTEAEIQVAVDELRSEMESKEFVDQLGLESVPPPEVVAQTTQPLLQAAASSAPILSATLTVPPKLKVQFDLIISADASPNDPYFANDVSSDKLILVVVNRRHPHWGQVVGSEGLLNYLRHCMYDAIAEWQCRRVQVPRESDTIAVLKDRLLRVSGLIQDAQQ